MYKVEFHILYLSTESILGVHEAWVTCMLGTLWTFCALGAVVLVP